MNTPTSTSPPELEPTTPTAKSMGTREEDLTVNSRTAAFMADIRARSEQFEPPEVTQFFLKEMMEYNPLHKTTATRRRELDLYASHKYLVRIGCPAATIHALSFRWRVRGPRGGVLVVSPSSITANLRKIRSFLVALQAKYPDNLPSLGSLRQVYHVAANAFEALYKSTPKKMPTKDFFQMAKTTGFDGKRPTTAILRYFAIKLQAHFALRADAGEIRLHLSKTENSETVPHVDIGAAKIWLGVLAKDKDGRYAGLRAYDMDASEVVALQRLMAAEPDRKFLFFKDDGGGDDRRRLNFARNFGRWTKTLCGEVITLTQVRNLSATRDLTESPEVGAGIPVDQAAYIASGAKNRGHTTEVALGVYAQRVLIAGPVSSHGVLPEIPLFGTTGAMELVNALKLPTINLMSLQQEIRDLENLPPLPTGVPSESDGGDVVMVDLLVEEAPQVLEEKAPHVDLLDPQEEEDEPLPEGFNS